MIEDIQKSHSRISEVSYNTMHYNTYTSLLYYENNVTGIEDSSESEDESQDLQGI